jgi:hypothetical protein
MAPELVLIEIIFFLLFATNILVGIGEIQSK